jgi:hypothetical protein
MCGSYQSLECNELPISERALLFNPQERHHHIARRKDSETMKNMVITEVNEAVNTAQRHINPSQRHGQPIHCLAYPAATQTRRLARSPTDALINLIVRCRLRCQIPIGLNVHPLIRLRIAVIPQWWPAHRGYVRELRVDTDVIENPPDLRALGNR